MDLPVNPPVAPMLAKPVDAIPDGDYVFEPKWDGFRSIVFRDGERPADDALLARAGHRDSRAVAGTLCDRRGDRGPGRRRPAAGFRGAATAHPPGGQPRGAARGA